jgi:hypothetical protein
VRQAGGDSPGSPTPATPHSRRKRQPIKTEQAATAMRNDIKNKKITTDSLRDKLEKELLEDYGTPLGIKSRETLRTARKTVLSEIVDNSNSDK